MTENKTCITCGIVLNNENWSPSNQDKNIYICKTCAVKRTRSWRKVNPEKHRELSRLWREANPEKSRASSTKRSRKRGHRPFNENKECPQYFGVHVAERVLSHVFKNVERMSILNPGYDFICNHGKKIDVKSSCQRKHGHWNFQIDHNIIADFFLCLAFDNREDLNPLYAWLIPGSKLNHLAGTSISPSTIHKWDAYVLDISKISMCCDALR